jgi:hypothetical protein
LRRFITLDNDMKEIPGRILYSGNTLYHNSFVLWTFHNKKEVWVVLSSDGEEVLKPSVKYRIEVNGIR